MVIFLQLKQDMEVVIVGTLVNVQTYIDGESALIGLTRNPPDLAILDIKMPRMDGEELLKKLKKKCQFQ